MSDEIDGYVPMNARDFLILFALVDGALHGYGMVKSVEAESDGSVRMDPANLYRSLRRLERDGLVAEVEAPDDEEDGVVGERRRYYDLTETGRLAVAREATRLARLARSAVAKDVIPRSEVV